MGLFDFFTKTIGIDPGSQNLRIVHNNNIIFNESAELSMDIAVNKVSGYGNSTLINESNQVIRPIRTVIADFHGFEYLLRGAIKQSINERTWLPNTYKMFFSLPMSATEVDKRAYRDSGEHAGAKEVYMVRQPCTCAIGMGILFQKKDFILVDFSASKTEVTVFANSIPIAEGTIRIGTWRLQHALKNYLFRNYGLNLGSKELESLLFDLGGIGDKYKVGSKIIGTNELHKVLNPYFTIIEDQILETLEEASRHQRIDKIVSNGFYFTGGGSYINWLTKKIGLNDKMSITISSNPLLDNINGLKDVIQLPKKFEKYLMV